MANEEQLAILKQGVEVWNKYREERIKDNTVFNIDLIWADLWKANLSEANLSKANLYKADLDRANLIRANLPKADLRNASLMEALVYDADLSEANLSGANLSEAMLYEANLSYANLIGANLIRAKLHEADLSYANLSEADLSEADFREAYLIGANLSEADLTGASLLNMDLTNAVLTDCKIYGISAWKLELEGAEQSNLVITRDEGPTVTVDDLEVAQFIYLLLNNKKIRNVLDTIGKKGVLILGRFSPERKQVLDALRDKLRTMNFVPMMFDFEGASTKDFAETVKILAGMCRFIIADITSPKSSPLELQATVPDYKVPFVPIIEEGEEPFSMFADLQIYPWMFDLLVYKDSDQLLAVIDKAIIKPALIKADELNVQKAEDVRKRHAEDYL